LYSRSRYEMKYLISESSAENIREVVQHYLKGDRYADPAEGRRGYLVHSVYMDTPMLQLYRQTARGFRNRFKLRVRAYDEVGPAFVEVKRRENAAIIKYRAQLRRPAAEEVVHGYWPGRNCLIKPDDDRAYDNLRYFCQLRDNLGATSSIAVTYRREAFEDETGDARITFDTELRGSVVSPQCPLAFSAEQWRPRLNGVVLELKFTDRVPTWMTDLVRQYQLSKISIPKYCLCIDRMREAGVERYSTALVGLVVVGLVIIYLTLSSFGSRTRYDAILSVQLAGEIDQILDALQPVFTRHTVRSQQTSLRQLQEDCVDVGFELMLRNPARGNELEVELKEVPGVQRANVRLRTLEEEI